MVLNGGIPDSIRVRRKAVWLTSVHLTYWFWNQWKYIAMPVKSMEILLWHSAGLNVTFMRRRNAMLAHPSIKPKLHWLQNNNVNVLEWPTQSPAQEFVVGLEKGRSLMLPVQPDRAWANKFGTKNGGRIAVSGWVKLREIYPHRLKTVMPPKVQLLKTDNSKTHRFIVVINSDHFVEICYHFGMKWPFYVDQKWGHLEILYSINS